MTRDTQIEHLHPVLRGGIERLHRELATAGLPFQLFEGFRSPQRQAELYAQGRTRPGRRVTNARPWSSYHQYGAAGDFVLRIDGRWSWDDQGERAHWWTRLHELARGVGLDPISWEKPHLQLAGVSLDDLRAGRYPGAGDETWAENLAAAISGWNGPPPAPPLPGGLPERPALAEGAPEPSPAPAEGVREPGPAAARPGRPHRVSARAGLRLRGGAGTSFEVLSVLPLDSVVCVLATRGEWSLVDLEGDGVADGFCYGSFLVPC